MSSHVFEYHLLHIRDLSGERTVALNAATYSIGRDSSNALMIHDPTVSRLHCLLIRLPMNNKRYVSRLVDGNTQGRRSFNGSRVNSQPYAEKILESHDLIQLGAKSSLSYLIAQMSPREFDDYFGHVVLPFHSVQEEILDPTQTLITPEMVVS